MFTFFFQESTDNWLISCCRECSCSDHCAYFGNCCHDKQNFSIDVSAYSSLPTPQCINTRRTPTSLVGQITVNISYTAIGTCPEDVEGVSTCFSESSLNIIDFIFVSGKSQFGTVIFRNRKCATCNNATEIREWTVKVVDCIEVANTAYSSIKELMEVVLNNCTTESIPYNSDEPYLDLYKCFNNNQVLRRCEGNNSQTVSQDIIQKCENHSPSYRHDYFTFLNKIYANYYCFKCNEPLVPLIEDCRVRVKDEQSFLDRGFTSVLDITYAEQLTKMEEKCMVNQIHDPYLVRSFES